MSYGEWPLSIVRIIFAGVISSGRFESPSEVVRTALRLLEERQRQKEAMLEWLAIEVQKGLESGPSEPVTPAFWQTLHDRLDSAASAADASSD